MTLSKRDKRMLALDEALDSLGEDAMLASEFDGFAAGVITAPEPIPPSEWLPWIWGGEVEAPDCPNEVFEAAFEVIMAHYNDVAATLQRRPEKYTAFYEADPDTGDILWEIWLEGFRSAMALRVDAWYALMQDEDSPAAVALSLIVALSTIADPGGEDMDLDDDEIDALTEQAPTVIPGLVATLYAARKATPQAAEPAAPLPPKVGRNDPCPCGSGKKYKKCCGAG